MALLACQRDSSVREGRQRVLSCEPCEGGFSVLLEDSLLYAEGGGQPSDRGWIDGVEIVDVQKAGNGRARCLARSAVVVGEALVKVDWERRWEHTQQHSAQHLITAIALERFGYKTVGFHLGETFSAIELDTPEVSEGELEALLGWVNEAIREARPVRQQVLSPEEYARLDVRSRGLPDTHEGLVRLIEIEGIDLNTCGGTHVSSTAELQMVGFVGLEKIRGRWRLAFLAGGRLLSRFHQQFEREKKTTQMLSCPPEEHLAALESLLETQREQKFQFKRTQRELATLLGEQLALRSSGLLTLHRAGVDLGVLEAIAKACIERQPEALVFLTSGAAEELEGEGIFLLAGPPDVVKQLGGIVVSTMEGRGGGRPGRVQGKVAFLERKQQVVDAFEGGSTSEL